MEHLPKLSVVVGVQGAQANIPAMLCVVAQEGVEVLLCHAADDPIPEVLLGASDARRIEGRAGAAIPELWRDGTLAARSDRLGLLSAHCVPASDWIETALALDLDGHVAHGGVIELASEATALTTAIHIQRYARVTPPQAARTVDDIAADNAVYRRSEILRCTDLLPLGFWEPSYHARFAERGLKLRIEPRLVAVHENCYTASEFMRQRRLHGRAFGRARGASAAPLRRAVLIAALPAAPLVFMAKLVARARAKPALRDELWRALPWLALFVLNWIWGEARGYLDTLRRREPAAEPVQGSAGARAGMSEQTEGPSSRPTRRRNGNG